MYTTKNSLVQIHKVKVHCSTIYYFYKTMFQSRPLDCEVMIQKILILGNKILFLNLWKDIVKRRFLRRNWLICLPILNQIYEVSCNPCQKPGSSESQDKKFVELGCPTCQINFFLIDHLMWSVLQGVGNFLILTLFPSISSDLEENRVNRIDLVLCF